MKILIFVLNILVWLFLFQLCIFHAYLKITGKTTYDCCFKSSSKENASSGSQDTGRGFQGEGESERVEMNLEKSRKGGNGESKENKIHPFEKI